MNEKNKRAVEIMRSHFPDHKVLAVSGTTVDGADEIRPETMVEYIREDLGNGCERFDRREMSLAMKRVAELKAQVVRQSDALDKATRAITGIGTERKEMESARNWQRNRAEKAEAKVKELEAKIVHCPNCGGDWADTGLTSGCSCRRIAVLEKFARLVITVEKDIAAGRVVLSGKFTPDAIAALGSAEELSTGNAECDHEWNAEITSQFSNEKYTEVKCKKCGVTGEQHNETGRTYWPCT